ncbi:hypothetical protein [Dyella acidisoli]|uniref:hypothetical protein n=1 Tax=Dyella acidisoli TaxID=1867834 RepID=UPI0024E0CC61|nr:hypothetical protein [Dyella acidisoli]
MPAKAGHFLDVSFEIIWRSFQIFRGQAKAKVGAARQIGIIYRTVAHAWHAFGVPFMILAAGTEAKCAIVRILQAWLRGAHRYTVMAEACVCFLCLACHGGTPPVEIDTKLLRTGVAGR